MAVWKNNMIGLAVAILLGITVTRAEIIGSDVRSQSTRSDENSFYLNTARPALCNGTITTIDYCYYGTDDVILSRRTYESLIAIYRPIDNNQNFIRVSESVTITKRTPINEAPPGEALLPGFNCESHVLDERTQVLVGDVIGVCFYDPRASDRQPLDLVSRDSDGYTMLTGSVASVECDLGVMPSGVRRRQLSRSIGRRRIPRILHISAKIESFAPTEPSLTTTTEAAFVEDVSTDESSDTETLSTTVLGIIVGAGLLGAILILLALIVIISVPFLVGKKRSNLETTIPHGNSSNSLLRQHPDLDENDADRYNVHHSFSTAYASAVNALAFPERLQTQGSSHQSSRDTRNLKTGNQRVHTGTYEMHQMQYSLRSSSYHPYSNLEGPDCSYDELMELNRSGDIYANVTPYTEPGRKVSDLYAQIKSYGIENIDRSLIQVRGTLGSGQFGRVESGVLKSPSHDIKVALKTLKRGTSEEDKIRFLQEGAIMAQFRHSNVILLYGIVSKDEPITMVTELAEKGDLQRHLVTLRPKSGELPGPNLPSLLLRFSQHVALGMQYLSGKGFVHRDLAARNILVSHENICKIADFGLSRNLADEQYYVSKGGLIPVKWTAPEAITHKKYSTASDVWSYGCVLYEIWSLGQKPYGNRSNTEAVRYVSKGKRLPPPPGCPRAIYELMINCWNLSTSGRPNFRALYLSLNENASTVLYIPQMDLVTHHHAGLLGYPLEAGERMYRELQQKYEDVSYYDDII